MKDIFAHREGSYIKVVIKEDNKADVLFFAKDIRGALVWPTADSPAYYCILAQRDHLNARGKLPLVFLAEFQSNLPKEIFQRLKKDARKYACGQFYNDFRKENGDLRELFYEFCRYQRIENIELIKAPLSGKLHIGAALIKQWLIDKALEIMGSTTLLSQLKMMQVTDLKQSPEAKFFAINALQMLIVSLEKEPWVPPMSFGLDQGAYARSREKADPGGWT